MLQPEWGDGHSTVIAQMSNTQKLGWFLRAGCAHGPWWVSTVLELVWCDWDLLFGEQCCSFRARPLPGSWLPEHLVFTVWGWVALQVAAGGLVQELPATHCSSLRLTTHRTWARKNLSLWFPAKSRELTTFMDKIKSCHTESEEPVSFCFSHWSASPVSSTATVVHST